MTEKRIFTHDRVFLHMTEHIIGKFPDNAVVWDADTVSEHEFSSRAHIRTSHGNENSQTAVIAVSFDLRTLNLIKDKNPNAIIIRRPLSISDFDNLFDHYDSDRQRITVSDHKQGEAADNQKSVQPPISVDSDTMTIQLVSDRKLKTIQLTAKEFNLFYILYLNKGKTVQRSEIITYLDGSMQNTDSDDTSESGNIIEVYIHYLRKKLGKKMIASVRGEGYRLEL